MSILIISASQRHDSQSSKVSVFVQTYLKKDFLVEAEILDLSNDPLPFWTDHPEDKERQSKAWQPIRVLCQQALGFVIVTPEWGGGITPVLKNFFLYCEDHELADKPAYIIGITSSYGGGSYPAAELRLSSFKNTHICFIPEQVIIRSVKHMLNTAEPVDEQDFNIRARLVYGLNILLHYANCMIELRDKKIRDFNSFPYGM